MDWYVLASVSRDKEIGGESLSVSMDGFLVTSVWSGLFSTLFLEEQSC